MIQMERWGGAGDDWRRLERDSGACCFEPCSLLVVGSIDGSIDSSIDSSLDGWMRRKEGRREGLSAASSRLSVYFLFPSFPLYSRISQVSGQHNAKSHQKRRSFGAGGGEIMGIGGMRTLLRGAAIVLYHGSVRQIIFAGHTISVRKLHFRTGGIICEAHLFLFFYFFPSPHPSLVLPFTHFPLSTFHFSTFRLCVCAHLVSSFSLRDP